MEFSCAISPFRVVYSIMPKAQNRPKIAVLRSRMDFLQEFVPDLGSDIDTCANGYTSMRAWVQRRRVGVSRGALLGMSWTIQSASIQMWGNPDLRVKSIASWKVKGRASQEIELRYRIRVAIIVLQVLIAGWLPQQWLRQS